MGLLMVRLRAYIPSNLSTGVLALEQCKKGWPRCPSCKTKLSLLTAGAAPQEGEDIGKRKLN